MLDVLEIILDYRIVGCQLKHRMSSIVPGLATLCAKRQRGHRAGSRQRAFHSPAPLLPSQTFMHQHLQPRLVTNSFSLGDFSSLSDIRLRQPDGNLRTLPLPVQSGDQGRASRRDAFRMQGSRLLLHIASSWRASPPLCLVTFGLKLRYLYRSLRHSLSLDSPPNIVAPLPRIQIVG